jgi:acyl-CoA oxidase
MTTIANGQQQAATVDVAALQRILDGAHADIRDRVREVLSRPQFTQISGSGIGRDEYRDQVLAWTKALAAEGGTGLHFPSEFGGADSTGGTIAAFETTAFGDLSLLVKVGVQFGLFGGAVLNLGTRRHHEQYLKDIALLNLPGCFAMTESGHGSDVQNVGTTATYDPQTQEFVVNTPTEADRKDYIGNAARHGEMAAVFCQLIVGGEGRGVHCVLVPIRDKKGKVLDGVRIADCGEKLGLEGVDNGRIWFDNVRVPRDNLLDRYAQVSPEGEYTSSIENPNRRFFTMLGTLVLGRVCVGGGGLSAAKSALTIAIRYGNRRRQFGSPAGGHESLLLDYRGHQRRLLPLLAKTYALHFAQEQLAAETHRFFHTPDFPERDQRKLESLAAGVKASATWHATETIQTCREACGGVGYLAVNRFAALKADSDIFTTFEGDNTVLMQLVAKSLMTDYGAQFNDFNAAEMVSFLAGQVVETVIERVFARKIGQVLVDAIPSREESADPLDRAYQLDLFRWREEHIVSSAARRLKRWVDQGYDAFSVFQSVQDHVLAASRAHIDRIILEAFDEAIKRVEDPDLAPVLDQVCNLYAVSNIDADRGWFQDHGRMTSQRSKAFTRALGQLCFDLRPKAEALVDAFGIPDVMLAAPIGQKNYDGSPLRVGE